MLNLLPKTIDFITRDINIAFNQFAKNMKIFREHVITNLLQNEDLADVRA